MLLHNLYDDIDGDGNNYNDEDEEEKMNLYISILGLVIFNSLRVEYIHSSITSPDKMALII